MHRNEIFYAVICINNHVLSCLFSMLSIIPKIYSFWDYNLNFHRKIDMHSKYDNMHKNGMFYALIYINNNIITCINCMLLGGKWGNGRNGGCRCPVQINQGANYASNSCIRSSIFQNALIKDFNRLLGPQIF